MAEHALAFAEAIYSLAVSENKERQILDDLIKTSDALGENKDYIKLMNAPDIAFEEKEKLIEQAFGESVCKYVLNFLKILAKNKLFHIVPLCKDEYEKSYNKANNIEKATVISAFELSDNLKEKLLEKLCEITGKKVSARYITDKSVLGGFVVRFSNSQVDASVKGRLEALKKQFNAI